MLPCLPPPHNPLVNNGFILCMGSFRRIRHRRSGFIGSFRRKKDSPEPQRSKLIPDPRHLIPGTRFTGSFRRLAEQGSEARQTRLQRPRFMGLFPRKKHPPASVQKNVIPNKRRAPRRPGTSRSRRHEIPALACGAAGMTMGVRCMGLFCFNGKSAV